MKQAVVIGTSTGIGRELAIELSRRGYRVSLCGRNVELMRSAARECGEGARVVALDISHAEESIAIFENLLNELKNVDLIVINSGISVPNHDLEWSKDLAVMEVNVLGFVAMAQVAFKFLARQGRGHLTGISSIVSLRGFWHAPAYNASKAFVSNYLGGLRTKAYYLKLPITVSDIRPGFVFTPLTASRRDIFWASTAKVAAGQIADAIRAQKNYAYITRRWNLIAWVMKCAPENFYLWLINRARRRDSQGG